MSTDERIQTALAIRDTHLKANTFRKRFELRVSRNMSSESIKKATQRAINKALKNRIRHHYDTWKDLAAWLADGDVSVMERIRQEFEQAEIRIDKVVAARKLMSLAAEAQRRVLDLRTWRAKTVFEAPGLHCSLRMVGVEPEMDRKEERERKEKAAVTAVVCLFVAFVAVIFIS